MTTDYVYNAQRLMDQVKASGSPVENYEYDAMGRRIRTVRGQERTITPYSGNDVVYEARITPKAAAASVGACADKPMIVDPIRHLRHRRHRSVMPRSPAISR